MYPSVSLANGKREVHRRELGALHLRAQTGEPRCHHCGMGRRLLEGQLPIAGRRGGRGSAARRRRMAREEQLGLETEEFPNRSAWGIEDEKGRSAGYFRLSYYGQSITHLEPSITIWKAAPQKGSSPSISITA